MVSDCAPGGGADGAAASPIKHRSVNACLAPLCSVDSCNVTTVEGIGSTKRGLHPAQERLARFHGSQCGFCTPGIVMSMYTLLRNDPAPSAEKLEHGFDGNLCRCTGYRPILDAAKTFACDGAGGGGGGGCRGGGAATAAAAADDDAAMTEASSAGGASAGAAAEVVVSTTDSKLADWRAGRGAPGDDQPDGAEEPAYDGSAEPSLDFLRGVAPRSLVIRGAKVTWHRPLSLARLLDIKAAHPDAKLVVGNTEVGIETKFKHLSYPTQVGITMVPELNALQEVGDTAITIGGAVTLSAMRDFLQDVISRRPAWQTRSLVAIMEMSRWFASTQIRNVAAVAGNIATASPISDLNPTLMACGATLTLASAGGGEREVPMSSFFLSYRRTAMAPEEVIVRIAVPLTARWEYVLPYKQARRRDDDISIVCAALRVSLEHSAQGWRAGGCRFAFGGMNATTVSAPLAEACCDGALWELGEADDALPGRALAALAKDMPLPENVPGGMAAFRQALAAGFLFKFFVATSQQLAADIVESGSGSLPAPPVVAPRIASASESFLSAHRPLSHGTQEYGVPSGGLQRARPVPHAPADEEAGSSIRAPVGAPSMHRSAAAQVTGEARYCDDAAIAPGSLHAALVMSTRPLATVVGFGVGAAEVKAMGGGVVAFFGREDVDGTNTIGAVIKDELVFRGVGDVVTAVGQPLGVVVAESLAAAQEAARAVEGAIEWGDAPDGAKPIFSIDDAIAASSFFEDRHVIERGDLEGGFGAAAHVIEGEMRVGGQEHFYLETNATLCMPGEGDEMTILSSTQNPSKTQNFVAHVLGVPANGVVCKVKRMGGGFGGKETRSVFVACAAAIAARKLGRQVRIVLDRDVDMQITGARHAFMGRYRAGVDGDGRLVALDVTLYCNGGYSLDLSSAVMDRALFHHDNSYRCPNVRAQGVVCKTNTSSNTAFRGFGGPQGMMVGEAVMDHAARALGLSAHLVRERNLYAEGNLTPYGQVLEGCQAQRMWRELNAKAQFEKREAEVAAFNAEHVWRKRGIAMIPTKFGISFTAKFMNQGGALVHVYTDGTVLCSHGGTEMGQGLHTKIAQIAARSFSIAEGAVTVTETATDKVANSSPTAASMSTDLYGMATLDACEQILERLKPIGAKMPGASFAAVVQAAFFQRVDLSAHGYYTVPGERCGYDWTLPTGDDAANAARGQPFNYFTYGTACAEVELDVLTGDICLRRADILMDLGHSINPAIDIGQVSWSCGPAREPLAPDLHRTLCPARRACKADAHSLALLPRLAPSAARSLVCSTARRPGGGRLCAGVRLVHDGGARVGRQPAPVGETRPTLHPRPWHVQDSLVQRCAAGHARLPAQGRPQPLRGALVQGGGRAAAFHGLVRLFCGQERDLRGAEGAGAGGARCGGQPAHGRARARRVRR